MPPPELRQAAADAPLTAADVLEVAAGVVLDGEGRILIARRPAELHQGGLWEFPGGKLEPGETPEQALRRELGEELDIEALAMSPLIRLRHDYPDRRVRLHVFRVERFRGVPRGLQGQPIRWVEPQRLRDFEFPAANRPIVAAARLPDHYAILDARAADPAPVRDALGRYAENGIDLVRLRANGLSPADYGALARAAAESARALGLDLILGGSPAVLNETGAAGLHLRSHELLALRERPVAAGRWLAVSCHGAEELRHAERIGADFAVLGPVLPTATHPGAPALGWEVFEELAAAAAIPVYALGGMAWADKSEAKRRGGQGIAAIRGFLEKNAP